MKILVWENDQIKPYKVNIDEKALNSFLEDVSHKYGYIRKIELKRKAIMYKELYNYCHEWENLETLKVFADRTKVHKGRKRVERREQKKKYLYSFTAIDMPEICHTIAKIYTQQDNIDLSIFNKYLFPPEVINYDDIEYYLEEGYQSYDKEALIKLRETLLDEEARKKYIDEIIAKRKTLGGEPLQDFFKTISFEPIDKFIVFNNEEEKRKFTTLSGILNITNRLGGYSGLIPYIDSPFEKCDTIDATPENILLAQANTEIIDMIKDNVKELIKNLKR